MAKNYIVEVSKRGQITIPKEIRGNLGTRLIVKVNKTGDSISLVSLKTREEFLSELDEIAKDYDKKGGYSIEQVMKKLKTRKK